MPESLTPAIDDAATPDDYTLMARIRGNDEHAFTQLIRRYQPVLLNLFARLGAKEDVEDLVQETFLRLYRYRARYRPGAKFSTFLHTLARHAWVDGLRKKRRRLFFLERWGREAETADARACERPRERLDAQLALERLPERLRSVVVLNLYQGLDYAAIAEILDVPVGTVKSRMFNALRLLRETMR